jgi:hypothetical protein
MGFEYDPSTAGSSVRFDPPNKNDKVNTILLTENGLILLTMNGQPITFHKRK